MIVFEKVHVKGFDDYDYVLNFKINPNTLNVIVTPALFDKRTLVRYIVGSSAPTKGRVHVGGNVKTIGLYDPERKPPAFMRIQEYVTAITDSEDSFHYLVEKLSKLGIKVDEYTIFQNIPQPVETIITLYTTLKVPKDLYILIDPFEHLDESLINFVMSILRETVKKGSTIIVVTSNKVYSKMFRFDQYIEVSKLELSVIKAAQRKIEIPEDCLVFEAFVGENFSENFFKFMLEFKGFRGVLMNRDRALILIEPKYRRTIVKLLRGALDEGVFRRVKPVE